MFEKGSADRQDSGATEEKEKNAQVQLEKAKVDCNSIILSAARSFYQWRWPQGPKYITALDVLLINFARLFFLCQSNKVAVSKS